MRSTRLARFLFYRAVGWIRFFVSQQMARRKHFVGLVVFDFVHPERAVAVMMAEVPKRQDKSQPIGGAFVYDSKSITSSKLQISPAIDRHFPPVTV